MRAEQQYIDLFSQCEAMICRRYAGKSLLRIGTRGQDIVVLLSLFLF